MEHRAFFRALSAGAALGVAGAGWAAPGDPLDNQFIVNTVTTNSQLNAAVARAADGRFVIVWHGEGPGDPDGIFMRLFDTDGTEITSGDVLVNVTTAGIQNEPAVSMNDSGEFVVVWTAQPDDIFVRRFDNAGNPIGNEFAAQLGSTTIFTGTPDVALEDSGDFLVVWASNPVNGQDVFARRFDPTDGFEATFVVNDASGPQSRERPAIAKTRNGNTTVVTWMEPQSASGNDIWFEVNPGPGTTAAMRADTGQVDDNNLRGDPDVAVDAQGNFALVWDGFGLGDNDGVVMRLFQADGTPRSAEIQANGLVANAQSDPAVAVDDDGDIVVDWAAFGTDDIDVVYRRFDAAGQARDPEQLAHTPSGANQALPAVGDDAQGNFVVAWQDPVEDGSLEAVLARRFEGGAGASTGGGPTTTVDVESSTEGKLAFGPFALLAALGLWGWRRARR